MAITKYLHTAILVSDLKIAEHFYSHILGLTKVDRQLKFPGVWYQIGDFQIHLIFDETIKIQLTNSAKLGRNPHLAFGVDNLTSIQERLESNGFYIQHSASGRAAFFTQDPDGNVIEINQIV